MCETGVEHIFVSFVSVKSNWILTIDYLHSLIVIHFNNFEILWIPIILSVFNN